MQIINMIENYKLICEEISTFGAFESYNRYTKKYKELFEGIFRVLYCTDITNLQPMIEQIDFNERLQIGIRNQDDGLIKGIIDITKNVCKSMDFHEDFTLYIGMELGNIGGCSGLPGCKAFIYIGIDHIITEISIWYTIPHEFNHMVRNLAIKDLDASSFCERVITEGLGSYAPLALYNMEFSNENVALALGLTSKQTERLMKNTSCLLSNITDNIDEVVTEELMKKYFAWTYDTDDYPLAGYYVGMYIIKKLIDKEYTFIDLTIMPSNLIWRKFQHIMLL